MVASVLSLVAALLWHGVAAAHLCDYADDASVQRNAYLQIPVITTTYGLGFSMCKRTCSNVTGSLSYNYFRPDGKCECLDESSATSPQALVSREGWHHGDIRSSNVATSDNCTCADGGYCVMDLPGLIRWPQTCPPPPALANADVEVTEGSRSASAASYTCHENFKFSGSSSHVTCTDRLTWTGLNGSCTQFVWYNVTTMPGVGPLNHGWIQPVPVPVTPGWKLQVVETPTGRIRSGISVMDEDNICMIFDMRITWEPFDPYFTEMASFINGSWTNATLLFDAPWRIGKTFNITITIASTNSFLLIDVDGARYTSYPSPEGCGPFTHIYLSDEMFAHVVRLIYPE